MKIRIYMTVVTKDGETHDAEDVTRETDLDLDEFKNKIVEAFSAIDDKFFAIHRCDGVSIIIPVDDIKSMELSFEVLEEE